MKPTNGMERAREIANRFASSKFHAKAAGKTGELYIYDSIGGWWGGVTAKLVADALDQLKRDKCTDLAVYINSPGGDVFDGVAIHNLIARWDAGARTVYIDGIAASAASVVAMAGQRIVIAPNAMVMIHDAWGFCMGNARDMRETADLLEKVTVDAVLGSYARTGQTKEQLRAWMEAETWMNATEAVERRFADEVVDSAVQEPDEDEEDGAAAAALHHPLLAAYAHPPRALHQRTGDAALDKAKVALATLKRKTQHLRLAAPAQGGAGPRVTRST